MSEDDTEEGRQEVRYLRNELIRTIVRQYRSPWTTAHDGWVIANAVFDLLAMVIKHSAPDPETSPSSLLQPLPRYG